MNNFAKSLQVKVLLGFFLMIAIVTFATLYASYTETKNALKEELMVAASIIAVHVDGDKMMEIKPGMEKSQKFEELRRVLLKIQKSHPDIKYVYTFKKHDDKLIEYIVDSEYGESEDAASIGEVYPETTVEMMAGLVKTSADKDFVTDKWGTYLSAYAPVFNSKGEAVAAVGVDMIKATALQKQTIMGYASYFVVFLVVILSAFAVGMFTTYVIRDIEKLNKAAGEISKGNMDVPLHIKRDDEIGQLADSFGRMIASLKIMMMPDDEEPKNK